MASEGKRRRTIIEIILANDFTNDTYGRRGVRLMEIQNNIEALQPMLNLPPELYN